MIPVSPEGGAAIMRGDALAIPLGDETVDCIVTSPPYFALRSYQDGGEHFDGQIGSEATPTAFLEALWAVTAECWRVLKPTGSLFVNLGDKYAGSGGHNNVGLARPDSHGGKVCPACGKTANRKACNACGVAMRWPKAEMPATRRTAPDRYNQAADVRAKSLMGLPWRYAIGCTDGRADPDGRGWVLRQELVWSKPNGMPESVTDRGRRSHEQFFHLTKNGTYWADMNPLREPHTDVSIARTERNRFAVDRSQDGVGSPHTLDPTMFCNPLGKLPDSVWPVATQPLIVPDWLNVDHFAAFPTEWPRRLILGWTPSGICTRCGEGRHSTAETRRVGGRTRTEADTPAKGSGRDASGYMAPGNLTKYSTETVITGESCACPDTSAPTKPAVVLDPFGGTGTTAMVARALGRYGVSMDLSADYLRLQQWRIWESDGAERVARKTAEATRNPQAAEAAHTAAARLAAPDQLDIFATALFGADNNGENP